MMMGIGLRMAVGAQAKDILRPFLAEPGILRLFGGIAGILLGHGVSFAVRAVLHCATTGRKAEKCHRKNSLPVLFLVPFQDFAYHLHQWAVFFPKLATVDQGG